MPIQSMRRPLISAVFLAAGLNASGAQPRVSVVYSPAFDSTCSLVLGGTIKEEWKSELTSRIPEFEALWATVGPRHIEAVEALTGKEFPGEEFAARLTLCKLPSQSFVGISVNMRYALKSFISPPVPMRDKVETLFHELLHVFLSRHPIVDSELLAAHSAEPSCVRNHLHLLALHKAVLLKREEPEVLQTMITIAGTLPSTCYKRAWDIVNNTDAEYTKYLAELAK